MLETVLISLQIKISMVAIAQTRFHFFNVFSIMLQMTLPVANLVSTQDTLSWRALVKGRFINKQTNLKP